MSSIFSKIVSGEIPSYTIEENDQFMALLDINPLVAGHVLVIPKIEVDRIYDLQDSILQEMIVFAKGVSLRMDKVIACKRMGWSVIGLEVPHAHIHLVPINSADDLNFTRIKLAPSASELKLMQEKLSLSNTP